MKDKVIELRRSQGLSERKIAETVGVSRNKVRKVLMDSGDLVDTRTNVICRVCTFPLNPDEKRYSFRHGKNMCTECRCDESRRYNQGSKLISEQEFETRMHEQSGLCAICKIDSVSALAVDHCHSTGKVRGLLCTNCNIALGMFKDNSDNLNNAIKYLNGDV